MKAHACALLMLALGCGDDGRAPAVQRPVPDKEALIRGNRDAVRLEDHDMDIYQRRVGLETVRTPRGVRYKLLRDVPGENIRPMQWAVVNYRITLLDGTTAYHSEPGQPEWFKVEMDDVESGLHEGIQYLSPGDSAVLIIPSYRAHGLIGDLDRIPPRSTVVYHIGLVRAADERR
jgi:FKBP-type peptidyl-prolyl cis-trans isomerase